MGINNTTCFAVIGLGVAALVLYSAKNAVDRPNAPHIEIATQSFNVPPFHVEQCADEEYFRPHLLTENGQLGITPHRYPNVTGGNISTLIHYGFSQLRLPSKMDNAWRVRPPAEVMW